MRQEMPKVNVKKLAALWPCSWNDDRDSVVLETSLRKQHIIRNSKPHIPRDGGPIRYGSDRMVNRSRNLLGSDSPTYLYSTAMTVLLGSLSPVLLTARTRYSHSLPRS